MSDWNPTKYRRYADVRLQPARDLLSRIGKLPEDGDVVDLGCGSGVMGATLKSRFPSHHLTGLDSSEKMLEQARGTGAFDALAQADIAGWSPAEAPALIFSNAALQWLGDHGSLIPALAEKLAPGGVLAVQMPYQNSARSHAGWGQAMTALFPGRPVDRGPGVLSPEAYFDLLSPFGGLQIWETEYLQHLPAAAEGHPVRLFTESTFARPFLNALSQDERARLIARYEEDMAKAYPVRPDGTVLFRFRRLFFVLQRPD